MIRPNPSLYIQNGGLLVHTGCISTLFLKKIIRKITTSETNIGAGQKVGRVDVGNCCF